VLDGVDQGDDASAWPIPQGFAGGLFDADTGLVRFGVRDYDPRVGRWTAKDPILFEGGQGNFYVYVGNGPVNRLDPTGTTFWTAVGGGLVGGAVAGGIAYFTDGNVGAAAAGGFVAGAIGGAVGGGFLAQAAVNIGGSAAGAMLEMVIKGEGVPDAREFFAKAGAGGILGAAANIIAERYFPGGSVAILVESGVLGGLLGWGANVGLDELFEPDQVASPCPN